jgi:tRNA(Ile)-lysidine synthase
MLNPVSGLRLLRPWLTLTRPEIQAYAERAKLSWVEDESNADEGFDRSFLRARVLPLLTARYPSLHETLGRAAQNLGDAAQLLDDLAARDARGAVAGDSLAVSALAALSPAGGRNVLRWFLEQQHLPAPTRDQLDEARRQALAARADARVRVKVGAAWLRRHRGRLYVEPAGREPAKGWRAAWTGQHELTLPGDLGCLRFEPTRGAGLSLARLRAEPVTVALRAGGERLRPAANRPSRTLKNLLHEAHVPEWERDRLPLIFVAETLVWVPGVGQDFRFAAAPDEPGLLPRWEHAGIVSP